MTDVNKRLDELGIKLPDPPDPLGAYKPAVVSGYLLFLSVQLPLVAGNVLSMGNGGAQVQAGG